MYAVFSDGAIAYLGDDRTDALETLDSKDGATLNQVNTLASLSSDFAAYKKTFVKAEEDPQPKVNDDPLADVSSAMDRILERLDEAGFITENTEEVYNHLRDKAITAVSEVRNLSIKSMAVVGEGFIALGDLLKAADDVEPKEGASEDESKKPVID